MADGTNYSVEVKWGRMRVVMDNKCSDGKYHSASCEYPFFVDQFNEEKGETEKVKLTRKETINHLLGIIKEQTEALKK